MVVLTKMKHSTMTNYFNAQKIIDIAQVTKSKKGVETSNKEGNLSRVATSY